VKTQNGMIVRRNRVVPEGCDDILWPVVKRTRQKGWRTGSTRIYTLKCGHYYATPASSAEGIGRTAHCIFCDHVWRWITTETCGAVTVDHAIKDLQPGVLAEMHNAARTEGRLVRTITVTEKEVSQ
jgi:hypothetical protein